ncbi:uncharacterized protein LOC116393675 isoform X2 [Anarrhichthys ocellatus]|uniref:uncharacterized protein LOC116393675 isoform X2 n=1 Tax=Anarrhichthys ocellatus TaxID=433405 RepID=UPI0012EEBDB3|nr:uncharacterized protein LOC116393675 isoform X2 [Anarrhichthys ocellatus]
MAEFRWIVMSSFLMLQVLSFRAAVVEPSSFTVRDGDEVTLPFKNVTHDQDECDSITWLFTGSGNTVPLFEHGKIVEAEAKSDRLNVSEKCSLVMKNVTDKDGGEYVCRQFRSGKQEGEDVFHLAVVTSEYLHHDVVKPSCWNNKLKHYNNYDDSDFKKVILLLLSLTTSPSSPTVTEQKNNDEVTLSCSVWTYGACRHRVKWLYEGDQYDEMTPQYICSARLRIKKSHLDQKSKSLLKCEVTDRSTREVHQFTFSPPQSSGVMNNETSENNSNERKPEGWWRLIVVPVGLAALIISVVTVNIWTRTTGNKTLIEENIERDDEDEDDGTVNYENAGEPSASVSLD